MEFVQDEVTELVTLVVLWLVRAKENIVLSNTNPTQSGERVSQGLSGVREVPKKRRQERFTTLLHHVSVELLRDSDYALKRQAAPGVDGVTWQEYETGLEGRLADLHNRIHRGAYRAQPSRRVYIAKADGRQRPLGIAALEAKIVQQAVVTILNQIYEVDFKGFSYGFRPGRSPHQALDALTVGIQRKRVNWVLDADIRGFFDNMSHEWTMMFVGCRRRCMVTKGRHRLLPLPCGPGKHRQVECFRARLRRLWWLILRRPSQRPAPWDRLLPIYTQWLLPDCGGRSVMIVPTASIGKVLENIRSRSDMV